jgi:DNA helicase-2/ATP-dependent DNA helicase PcrA
MITLSPEQMAVVDHPLEPLRVSAGAGTGKTTTVARRIAALVCRHGLEPAQVLGVTFTNKAAEELADRVRTALGPVVDPGDEVEIHTYHGFAAQLLREFGALVGVDGRADVITPTFTRQMLTAVVRSTPFPNLSVTHPGAVDGIRRFAAFLSDHLVDRVVVPDDPDPAGPWPARADLIRAVEVYAGEKRRLGVVDYGDLIQAAHRLVTRHPWVAARVRARYRAVVLDEYQDTNPAQRMLFAVLFGDGFPVTAVGDPDQTIYEWRGASLGNFRRFPEHFPTAGGVPCATLPLSLNRRSSTAILAVANAVRARTGGEPPPPLVAPPGTPEGSVRAGWFGDAVAEAEWVADQILAGHDAGWAWSDVAVLFRKNKDMGLVRDALASRDIPVEVGNLGGLLSVPEVVEIHAWLRLLEYPDDGAALVRLLCGSRHRLGLADLAALARWVATRPAEGAEHEAPPAMIEAIDHLDQLDNLRPEAATALAVFGRRYRLLLEAAQGTTLVELCRSILDVTGSWRDLEALSSATRLSARLNLYRFLDLAEQWSPLEGRPSLAAFLDYLATMDEEPSEELDTARLAGADAVRLLTVHRAKGLEWPVVFLPGAYHSNFPSRVMGAYDNPYTRPESLPYEYRLDRDDLPPLGAGMGEAEQRDLLAERHHNQEWRIAYVAVTRAREQLTVTGAHWYGQPEPIRQPARPSALFELVAGHPAVEVVNTPGDPPPRPETLGYRTDRNPAPDPLFTGGWAEGLRQAGAGAGARHAAELGLAEAYDAAVAGYQQLLFRLPEPPATAESGGVETSVTGLVNYATCPKRYHWTEIDRLPRRYSPAARRGVDIHRRIELHHRGVIPFQEPAPDRHNLPDEPTGPDPFAVFERSRFARERPFLVEAPFQLGLGDDVTVRGRIDAVYRHDDDIWEVVDFKSGHPTAGPAATVQLEAYALAVQRGALGMTPPAGLRVTFAYLGGGLEERTGQVDGEWMARAESHLGDLAAGIEQERFEPSPSEACRRCDFLRFCPAGRAFVA